MKDAMCSSESELDLFDSLVSAEEQSVSQGFEEGVRLGQEKNHSIGFEEGESKGREIGSEVGFYAAWALIWKSLDESLQRKADRLLESSLAFPTSNSASLDTALDGIRGRFKLVNNSVKRKPYAVDYNPGNELQTCYHDSYSHPSTPCRIKEVPPGVLLVIHRHCFNFPFKDFNAIEMDSGVETEPESTTPVPPPRLLSTGGESASATPEPTSFIQTNPSEDGYLGDCSSDGGNEKNFPMPSDLFSRFEVEDPPAGIAFEHVKSVSSNGYARTSHSRKMKNLYYGSHHTRSFRHHHSHSEWSAMKANLAEKRLRTAVGLNDEEAVKRLCKSANPNAADGHRRTGLHIAAAKGYASIVSILLEAGADPNQKDALGNTALHLAACTNHIDVVTLLLRAGTNVTTLDNNGRTPIQLAQSKLKILQKTSTGGQEMSKVKAEVGQVLEMMREYLTKTGIDAYDDLLNNFSSRFNLHQTLDQVNSDLQDLLDSLGNLSLKKNS